MKTLNVSYEQTTAAVLRTWFNGFAETCYELDNGTTICINYGSTSVRIIKTSN